MRFESAELFPIQPRLDGFDHLVTGLPSFGVEVNETAVSTQSQRFWEAPHLERRDGSVTNW